MNTALPFQTVLLLVEAEPHAAVDRRALRDLGVAKVRIFTSGLLAARVTAGHVAGEDFRPDIIICHNKTTDMTSCQFAELVRAHPRLLGLPMLLVAGNDDEATRIDAVGAGFSNVLVRPYSTDALRKALLACCTPDASFVREGANALKDGGFDDALRHYEISWTGNSSPDEAFQQGLMALQERQWDNAIQAFQRALRAITLKGEAELGLAAAWRGKGDIVKYRQYLNDAAHTFARATQWHKARATYARLLRSAPDAPSPFLNVAEALIRAGKFDEAAETLAAGYEMGNVDDAAERLAQACSVAEQPEECVNCVRESMRQTPLAEIADTLDAQIRAALHEQNLAAQARRRAIQEHKVGIPSRAEDAAQADTDNIDAELEDLTELSIDDVSADQGGVLAPLPEKDMTPSPFANVPLLGDAIAVARVTWRLLRKSGG